MITTIILSDTHTQIDAEQKWFEPFQDFMDQIYYSGYSQHLIDVNPDVYKREYLHFIQLYGS